MCCTSKVIGPKGPKAHNKIYINTSQDATSWMLLCLPIVHTYGEVLCLPCQFCEAGLVGVWEMGNLSKLGNGESIKVLMDKWIPNYPSNRVLHLVHEGEEDWRVSNFIDSELHGWRRDIIMETFNREDAEAICKIPLSYRHVTDVVVWLHNKDGVYTVRSGCHVAQKVLKEWAKSSTGSGQQIWKKLWKVGLPNKMKVFA